MTSEAQKKAVKKYKRNVKRITLDFAPTEIDLFEQISKQPKKQTYIKDLIRADVAKSLAGAEPFIPGAEPIIHARWEMIEKEAFWISDMEESLETGGPTKRALPVCSHCKTEFGTVVLKYKRCPECGAKMDLEVKE